jgi:hypothetical protein
VKAHEAVFEGAAASLLQSEASSSAEKLADLRFLQLPHRVRVPPAVVIHDADGTTRHSADHGADER